MATFTRRAFLVFSAAFAWIAGVGAGTDELNEFLRLSQRLVGRKSLDAKVAAIYLEALLAAPGNRTLLSDLARASVGRSALSEAHLALERTIIEWWYTGVYEINGERRVATHTDALMWEAIGVPAASVCAGVFGDWSRSPKRAA